MSWWAWMLLSAGAAVVAWALFVGALLIAGRREWAVALARFVPDCIVLVRRLLGDERVPWRHKALLGAMLAYLALPFDLVPDFIPVAGQLDDVLVVGFVLRRLMHGAGRELVREHWPGPPAGLELVLRCTTTA